MLPSTHPLVGPQGLRESHEPAASLLHNRWSLTSGACADAALCVLNMLVIEVCLVTDGMTELGRNNGATAFAARAADANAVYDARLLSESAAG